MTLRTDSLTQSLPQKGTSPMAKKPAPQMPAAASAGAAGALTHHQSMGMAAHAAMQHLTATGMQSAAADPMNFSVPGSPSVHEDFTPRAYTRKPNPQG